jgi:hypothetical protein
MVQKGTRFPHLRAGRHALPIERREREANSRSVGVAFNRYATSAGFDDPIR